MFHQFGNCVNTKGDALPGWYVECVEYSDMSTVVSIYSDENSTPIISASGVANRALVDVEGNYDFFVTEGTYGLKFYDHSGVFQGQQRYLPMYGADASIESSKANATALGIDGDADDMGTFTGSTITSNGTAKAALQELETANEAIVTNLAASTGAGLVGFSHSETYSDGTIGSRLRHTISVKDAPFSAKGDGTTDDTTAINNAMTLALSFGADVLIPAGTYKIAGTLSNPGVELIGAGEKSIFQLDGLDAGFDNSYTVPGSGYALNSAALNATSITLTTAGEAANFAVDTYAIVTSEDYYDSPNLDPQKKGEFVRIKTISSGTLTLYGPLSDVYTTTPKIVPVTLMEGLAYRKFRIIGDRSVSVVGGADADIELRNVINTRFALRPKMDGVMISDQPGAALSFEGCYEASVDGFKVFDLGCATESDGTAADGFGGYGYGIIERGINFGGSFTNVASDRVRHTVTGGGSFLYAHGRPVGAQSTNCTARNPKLSGFDGHEIGYGMRFTNCWTFGAMGPGFTVRNDATQIRDCGAVGCLAAAVALYKGATENAQNCVVDGFYADGNNWGTDYLGTDWTLQPTFLNQGDNNRIMNTVTDSAYGPLYSTAADAVGGEFTDFTARNINKVGTANNAIWLRATGVTTPVIMRGRIDASNGFVSNVVRNDSTNGNNIPAIDDLRIIGTITGMQYSSATSTNRLVHWTGSGLEGLREDIALAGATTIDLNGRIGHTFKVTRTASESLTTVTGRDIDGAILELVGGTGGFHITHGTGANALYLNSGTSESVNASQRIRFKRDNTVWVEQFQTF